MDDNRIGYIEVHKSITQQFWQNNKNFVPLHIEPVHHYNRNRYLCWSISFRKLEDGEIIPQYKIEFKKLASYSYELIKVEEVINNGTR